MVGQDRKHHVMRKRIVTANPNWIKVPNLAQNDQNLNENNPTAFLEIGCFNTHVIHFESLIYVCQILDCDWVHFDWVVVYNLIFIILTLNLFTWFYNLFMKLRRHDSEVISAYVWIVTVLVFLERFETKCRL